MVSTIVESTQGDTKALPKAGGTCATFTTPDPEKWCNIFREFYFNPHTNEDNNNEWESEPQKNTFKYTINRLNFSTTTTIHKNGTVVIQGNDASMRIWWDEHYPPLTSIRARLEKNIREGLDVSI